VTSREWKIKDSARRQGDLPVMTELSKAEGKKRVVRQGGSRTFRNRGGGEQGEVGKKGKLKGIGEACSRRKGKGSGKKVATLLVTRKNASRTKGLGRSLTGAGPNLK